MKGKVNERVTSHEPDRFINLSGLLGFFETRLSSLSNLSSHLHSRATQTAAARLATFLLITITTALAIKLKTPEALIIPLAGLALFLTLVKKAAAIENQIQKTNTLIQINQEEIEALNGNHKPFNPGTPFINPQHEFSYDLDLFGPNSIFQMTCRAETPKGRNRLAHHLANPETNPDQIIQWQTAAKELAAKPLWRQNFQAEARLSAREISANNDANSWPPDEKPLRGTPLLIMAIAVNATIITALITLTAYSLIPAQTLLYLLLPAAIVLYKTRTVNRYQKNAEQLLKTLGKYQPLVQQIEQTNFSSPYLQKVQNELIINGNPASQVMKQLNGILWGLELRGNIIVASILNLTLLWDIWMMIRLQNWKTQNKQAYQQWTNAVASIERITSIANFACLNPNHAWPKPVNEHFILTLENAGHPLIPAAKRVTNSLSFNNPGQLYLITGANMSGKSTLLRMTGVNLVLAMNGAPVCASQMTFTPVHLMTSIRTSDSLSDEESYFYAELKKLNRMVTTLQSGAGLFVIIDEMLRGTNSKDKHAGSAAFIRRLISLQASGLVATHDVELGALAKELPNHLTTSCFEVAQAGETLTYDYTLRPGISQSLNATFLMREMGII